jgi:hypothetical protein
MRTLLSFMFIFLVSASAAQLSDVVNPGINAADALSKDFRFQD